MIAIEVETCFAMVPFERNYYKRSSECYVTQQSGFSVLQGLQV